MLMKAVALKSVINTLPLVSFNVVKPGVASQSLGVDGLSQSKSTTASAKTLPLQNLIDQYQSQFDKLSDLLKKKYSGLAFGVLG
jgi:hypothetical protein